MRDETKPVQLATFPGLKTNIDALDIEPGAAQIQQNITSLKPGQLDVRKGFRDVNWED